MPGNVSALLLVGLAEFCQYVEIFERAGVAGCFVAGGDVSEEASHDFAAAGFGDGFGETDVVGNCERTDFFSYMSP